MSIKLMAQVWECQLTKAEQSVLLAMADHAKDDGSDCYPGVDRIAWKTDYSDRQVQRVIADLCKRGILIFIRKAGRGRGNEYRIDLSKAALKPEYVPRKKGDAMSPYSVNGDTMSPQKPLSNSDTMSPFRAYCGVTPCHRLAKRVTSDATKGDISSVKGDIAMSPEPITNKPKGEDDIDLHSSWLAVLGDLRSTSIPNFPALKWLESSRIVEAGELAGIPFYRVEVSDPRGVDWLRDRMAGQLRRSLSISLKQRIELEIAVAQPQLETEPTP